MRWVISFFLYQGHARDDSWEFLHEFPLCLDTLDPPVYTLDEEFKEELAKFKKEVSESMGHHNHKVGQVGASIVMQ